MRMLIVRHAESVGNASGDYSSQQAGCLSIQGEQQAVLLADVLSGWTFDRIITSPLQRAMQTIAPYLAATQQRAEIWPEIAEACWHDEREPLADDWHALPSSFPQAVDRQLFAYRDNHAIQPAHPESFGMGLRRVHCALERIQQCAAEQPQATILMVTHGHFARELLNLMLARPDVDAFRHDNCGRTLMQLRKGWAMEFFNRGLEEDRGA